MNRVDKSPWSPAFKRAMYKARIEKGDAPEMPGTCRRCSTRKKTWIYSVNGLTVGEHCSKSCAVAHWMENTKA